MLRSRLTRLICWLGLVLTSQAGAQGCATAATAPAQPSSRARPVLTRFASPYTYEWFIRAELLRADGRIRAAIEAYRMALAGSDDDPYLLARFGSALDAGGEHERARHVLDEALERAPESEAVWLARAQLAERRGAVPEALYALERAAQAAPQSARAPLALAKLLEDHGQPERARHVLSRYRRRFAQAGSDVHRVELDAALLRGDPDGVFAATLPYRMGEPPRAADRLNRAAQLLLEKGRPALALRVIELLPSARRDASLELRVLAAVGSTAAIEAWLVMHEPSSPETRIQAAREALLVGKVERAARVLEADRLLRPGTPAQLLLSAQIAEARAQYLAAAEEFVRVPPSSSVGPDAKHGLASALTALGLEALAQELVDAFPRADSAR